MVPLKVPLKARVNVLLPNPLKHSRRLLNPQPSPRLPQLGLLRPTQWTPTYRRR